jgi:hypothetical protein
LEVEYFLVHGSNFVNDIVFKWRQGPDLQVLDPVKDEELKKQGIYQLVQEPVRAPHLWRLSFLLRLVMH